MIYSYEFLGIEGGSVAQLDIKATKNTIFSANYAFDG